MLWFYLLGFWVFGFLGFDAAPECTGFVWCFQVAPNVCLSTSNDAYPSLVNLVSIGFESNLPCIYESTRDC